ncbi:uncharacterized protein LAJ45_00463 [Morchella importuna]|uniref:uncharacterized protein n=1 Tax=Morchella importuna TaxID=1174673 RepID=UPI001E8DB14F|nr:uncharacterized protein LAJ45_00463 [Morchella importuna]KAH8155453.1 hypothetical protein LAJ45_00463 [Morchella importuna]
MANDFGRAGVKTPKGLKAANVRTNRADKKTSVGETRGLSSTAKKRKKKRIVYEHPLAKAFNDSLSKTTSHVSTKLSKKLMDNLQMALSQIGATTARSQMYLVEASELKSRLFTSTPLLSTEFEERVEKFQLLVKKKTDLLDILCANWTECVSEIVNLGIEEGALKHRGEENNIQKADSDSLQGGQTQRSGDAKDDEEFDHLLRDIKAVNKVWTKKMEDSEKKIADELLNFFEKA